MIKRYILRIILFFMVVIASVLAALYFASNSKRIDKNYIHAFNNCEIILNQNKYEEALACFSDMLTKYDNSNLRYNYALALAKNKNFEEAKKELEYIIESENKEAEIVKKAEELDNQINGVLSHLRNKTKSYSDIKENNVDVGDYYSDLGDDVLRWENPTNITVYISDDPKKGLYEKAFRKWNGALGGIVYFDFVDNPKKAKIVCSFVKQTQGNEGGATDWHFIKKNGVQYIINSSITVTKHSPHTGKALTDNEIYSIILHEIGHAIGISGHSKFKGDIMYFSTENYLNAKGLISKRDINTIKKIYKK